MPLFSNIYIVGPGLLGGSIALKLKAENLLEKTVGIFRSEESIPKTLELGIVDVAYVDPKEAFALESLDAERLPEIVVLCSPVGAIVSQVENIASCTNRPLLVTDVGSTKAEIVKALDKELPNGCRFIGSHPIAGSEKSGPENARSDLFEEKTTIITPTPRTVKSDLELIEKFWNSLGSSVFCMGAEEHDRILAKVSHLPHLLSSLLMNSLAMEEIPFIGSGFRDMARLAAGNARMWTDITISNREQLLEAISGFQDELERFRYLLEEEKQTEILAFLEHAKSYKESL